MKEMFDHEKLDVYGLTLCFITWSTNLLVETKSVENVSTSAVRDHLDRASLSILLNTAEGNGKRQRQIRAKFFDDARGSATECAACLDALVAKGACKRERIHEGKEMLVRVVSMLCRLVERFSEDRGMVMEDESEYHVAGEESSTRTKDEYEERNRPRRRSRTRNRKQ
jgi:four helix bundle protein